MKQIPNKKLLTTYGCSAIGTTEKRRINLAELTETKKEWSDLHEHGSAPLTPPPVHSTPKNISTIHDTSRIFITTKKITPATTIPTQTTRKQVKTSKPIHQKTTTETTRNIKEIIIARNKKEIPLSLAERLHISVL